MANLLLRLFIFPGLVFSVIFGLIASWIDRKVTARVQYRVGPPFLQPYYDIRKLFAKEITVPHNATYWIFVMSPIISLAAVTVEATMLGLALLGGSGFSGDLILIIYLLMIPPIMTVLGAFSSGNPLSVLGASREIKLLLAYETLFVISILVPVYKTQTITLAGIMEYQTVNGPLLMTFSGAIAFLLGLLVTLSKLGVVPFDIAEAETEISSGVYMEYSGPLLAFWKLSRTILLVTLPTLLIILFFPSANFLFFIKYLIILVILTLARNTNPRLRIDQILKIFWGCGVPLGLAALLLATIGL